MTEPAGSPSSGGPSGPRAGFGSRLLAALIDGIIVGVAGAIIYGVLGAIGGDAGLVIGYVLAIILGVAYYAYFEGGATGQTLGKKVASVRVIDMGSGGSIGYGRAVGRYFARILSSIPCLLGYLWMLWDGEKQTWHDKLVSSVVVPESAYPVGRS